MKFYEPDNCPEDWGICIHQHSRVNDILDRQNFRGLHCVRHPKALILSATLYHQKCIEPWVDVPLDGFSSHTLWAASDGKLYNKIKNPEFPAKEKQRMMGTGDREHFHWLAETRNISQVLEVHKRKT